MGASEYAGLTAVVTGGASGIGLATARLLAARGARVACLDLKPDDVPAPLAGIPADVAVRAAVEEAAQRLGGIDILVDNAGIGAQGSIEGNTDDEWRRVFEVNVFGIVRVSRAALPHLRRSRSAAIVNTCSIAATAGLPDRALYSSTKCAVLSLTRATAADLVHSGIRVNWCQPRHRRHAVDRPSAGPRRRPRGRRAALGARQPMGQLVTTDVVVGAIAYLASPFSGSTTGTDLAVDGGMHGLRIRPRA
ncbi:SDR family NAD(P)-dependent oxidoreductase [Streptomyces sp. NPDC001530]|uniref:SDR family NAD(P)-dependent oxidoreductase n=1 Tax=Streptomyces sp. NPDC001530 TaxID=3364582 RepID=UPI0036C1DCC3